MVSIGVLNNTAPLPHFRESLRRWTRFRRTPLTFRFPKLWHQNNLLESLEVATERTKTPRRRHLTMAMESKYSTALLVLQMEYYHSTLERRTVALFASTNHMKIFNVDPESQYVKTIRSRKDCKACLNFVNKIFFLPSFGNLAVSIQ